MSPNSKSFDTLVIASKENIRKNIRHALTKKKSNTPINIDITTPLFIKDEEYVRTFVSNFRNSGGVFIPCTKENFSERLLYLLNSKKYHFILNTNKSLNKILEGARVSFSDFIEPDKPVDAAIVYSDILISRSGSLLFSQKYSLYPSVLNLGTDLLVIGLADHILEDLGTVFKVLKDKYEGKMYEFTEIITPTKKIEDQEYTPQQPQIILFFIQ
jgi:hypothetical protein